LQAVLGWTVKAFGQEEKFFASWSDAKAEIDAGIELGCSMFLTTYTANFIGYGEARAIVATTTLTCSLSESRSWRRILPRSERRNWEVDNEGRHRLPVRQRP
jgi:hypothetical protein